ncbi:ArdC-like ssDNA-binding domain-containing protein [Desulfofundulus salinus]|nr:ArdC-like ssDNA-binding domain-containing protein [Desulfofundulus salinum]
MGRAGWSAPRTMTVTEKARETLNRLLEMFRTGDLPHAVARTVIRAKAGYERPSDRWSLGNRLLMYLAGTEDARGFKQWEEAGRHVKKGARAFYILAPCTKKKTVREREIDSDTGEEREVERERVVITGFRCVPVFRYEDTEGAPLPEVDYAPPEPPPLFDVAMRFVGDVKYKPFVGGYYGYFDPARREIVLNTHDARTFFHELAHAVHHQVKPGGLKPGQHADQEIVAEVVAAALCEMYGFKGYIWHGWEYIRHYAGQDGRKALKAVMGVLADVEKVLEVILEAATPEERGCAA